MHPRLRGFLLFLLFAVVSQLLGGVLQWAFVEKLHVIGNSDE